MYIITIIYAEGGFLGGGGVSISWSFMVNHLPKEILHYILFATNTVEMANLA